MIVNKCEAKVAVKRNSTIELLLIVCMFLIVLGHLVGNGLNRDGFHDVLIIPSMFILSASVIAVNCFVLISGFYLIKNSINSALKIFFEALFYSLTLYCLSLLSR